MLNDMIDRLSAYTNEDLMRLINAIKDALRQRIKLDPNMYVVRRLPRNDSECVRYQSSRTGAAGAFEATSLDAYNLVVYSSRRWAEFVAENKAKMQTGRAKYDVIVLPKDEYYQLPAYQKAQVADLQQLRKHSDKTVAEKAEGFLMAIDSFNGGHGCDPRFLIKDWLERI